MNYLTEAFKQMELLESEQFSFDKDGAAKLENFLEDDMLNEFEAIIDPEAETKEELKDSYMGNVICRCPICKSMIYREPEEIVVSEEDQLANVEEPCPYCFEAGGFEIVGQVAPYEEVTVEGADENTKVEVDGQEVDTNSEVEEDDSNANEEEESLNESLFDKLVQKFPELADESSTDNVRARRHSRDNEDIEDSQRFPVEGTNQRNLMEKRVAKRRHTRDNEDLEDSQRYPIESPVCTKGLKEDIEEESKPTEKNLKAKIMAKKRHARDNEDLEDSQRYPIESPAPAQTGLREAKITISRAEMAKLDKEVEEAQKEVSKYNIPMKRNSAGKDEPDFSAVPEQQRDDAVKAYERYVNAVKARPDRAKDEIVYTENLKESMEDISITTDDQVIKVKATPRADKETIQPVEDEVKDVIEAPVEDEEVVPEEEEVNIEDFDEESFDTLGEGYLKNVYENVNSFKTLNVKNQKDNLIVEGVISFNSGKKAKTKFIFEAKDATKGGKLRFSGLNENISKNKKAFTLTGNLKEGKLISESLNYNYSAKDANGKSKRLYGTIRK